MARTRFSAAPSMQALSGRRQQGEGMPQMVRADQFDPSQGGSSYYDPRARLQQLEEGFRMNPGRAPNGTGTTGLLSSDSKGWSKVLEEQQEYARLQDLAGGGSGDLDVRVDPRSNFRSALTSLEGPRDWSKTGWASASADQPGSALSALQERYRGGYTSPGATRNARLRGNF